MKSNTFWRYQIWRTRLGEINTLGGIGHVWGNDTFWEFYIYISQKCFQPFGVSGLVFTDARTSICDVNFLSTSQHVIKKDKRDIKKNYQHTIQLILYTEVSSKNSFFHSFKAIVYNIDILLIFCLHHAMIKKKKKFKLYLHKQRESCILINLHISYITLHCVLRKTGYHPISPVKAGRGVAIPTPRKVRIARYWSLSKELYRLQSHTPDAYSFIVETIEKKTLLYM